MEPKTNGMSLKAQRLLAYIVLIFITIICLFWFLVLIVNCTRSNAEMGMGFTLIPSKYLAANWKSLNEGILPIWNGLFNSIFIAFCTGFLSVYVSAMTAYGVHVYRFKGRKFIATFILAVMMIPSQVTALGFLQLINVMGLMDNWLALIVPSAAAPITYFYMKQYFESTLPMAVVEAARIDGAGEFKIFNTIVFPIIKPALAVQMIFAFVTSWNNYFTPALVIQTQTKKTLPILIAQLRSADWLKFDMGQVYVMIGFSILPVVVVYLLLSKFIVQGVALGSVKG